MGYKYRRMSVVFVCPVLCYSTLAPTCIHPFLIFALLAAFALAPPFICSTGTFSSCTVHFPLLYFVALAVVV